MVFPASDIALAERKSACPMPDELIAKLFPTSLNLSTMVIAFLASIPNPCIVEIILSEASLISEISSPTLAYTDAAFARSDACSILYPSLAKSAVAFVKSLTVDPICPAVCDAVVKNFLYVASVSSVTFFNSVRAVSISFTYVIPFLI